jgi:hypothetical protein
MPKINSMISVRMGRNSRPTTDEEAKKIFEDYYRRVDKAVGRKPTVLSFDWGDLASPSEEDSKQ